ncbi:MAG: leucyl/phenylalanyl-tRNA--protein transferase [Nitrospirae bacterium]|nr:MAG: leucyl/phenylalanyl-tRNA--protein transferase [Nitrospirota bacterium]
MFYLDDRITEFPPPEYAEEDGLLAVGGDLRVERLLKAYKEGIFPWYSEGSPILWWSPNPRPVIFPERIKISRSLRQKIKKDIFQVTMDRAFERVILLCREVHLAKDGDTWLTHEMIDAYVRLHSEGYAHSVETWMDGRLVGGLYGVSLGAAFFGESMFTTVSDASKVALVALTAQCKLWGFHFIDAQVRTEHIMRFGAVELPRSEFLMLLKKALNFPTKRGRWSFDYSDLRKLINSAFGTTP